MKKKTIIVVLVFVVMLMIGIDNKNSNGEQQSKEETKELIDADIIDDQISTEDLKVDRVELEYNIVDIQTTMYAQKNMNVRSGPGTSYSKMGKLIQNQEVIITGQADNGWYRIDYSGIEGFASNTLIGANPIEVVELQPATIASISQDTLPVSATPVAETPTTANVEILQSEGEHNASYAQSVIDLVNSNRAASGLGSLTSTPELMSAAAKRAEEIVTLFEHQRPDGRSWSTIAADYNIAYTTLGENIAEGQTTPDEVMTGWMNSPGHQENILKPEFGHIGVGSFLASDGRYYWAQLFTN